ncbi:hypothetical protein QQG09_00020 [Melissococcus plutonius]|uniref:Uncharacterized protein n=1 Tax=Melissococcus plutonius TaxID=33970 RepID=A0A2Z5Y3X5_9ENTE|nr:hypothetical protein [Melissococcus plutonius]BAL62681.1 hypothetical protein MPD5_1478 [Melissococcus plutonius DAT561]MCV2498601.1 hypothetical protein [Melissococcus plutonius]MCV2500710.1 hypothetical protein [Melissococcus plutonius]MCV2504732.1 hypothetical protein [Melissococcus plutonius]MCV2507191.1 hypothetical protein [Melissococcus plutonius]
MNIKITFFVFSLSRAVNVERTEILEIIFLLNIKLNTKNINGNVQIMTFPPGLFGGPNKGK